MTSAEPVLKTYKNQLYETLTKAGLSIADFEVQEEANSFILCYRPLRRLYFKLTRHQMHSHVFEYIFTLFDPPTFPSSGTRGYRDFKSALEGLSAWIREIQSARREADAHDLWAEFAASTSPVS